MLSKTQILACYIRKVAILKVMLETESERMASSKDHRSALSSHYEHMAGC